jgi:hypothetical protein
MTPKTITLADDVFEQVKQRAEAAGVTVEEAANQAVRLGLSEDRWQKLMKRRRNYSREMAEAATGRARCLDRDVTGRQADRRLDDPPATPTENPQRSTVV